MKRHITKGIICTAFFCFYTFILVRWAGAPPPPPPPPPSTPIWNDVVNWVTIGGISLYGVWRIWR
ncbi:MAG: hypothetical protein HYS23_14740 [Geobacter sp.]|nr:hypothetical protein [Geobacter sp.]